MSTLPARFFRAGLVFFVIGVALGVGMPIISDMTLRPVHAHVNLLGFVAFFIYGFFYKLYPEAAATKLAVSHWWSAVVSLPPMLVGLGFVVYGLEPIGGPMLLAGEVLAVVSVGLFVAIVFTATRAPAARRDAAALDERPAVR